MPEGLNGRWAHGRLDAELISTIPNKLGELTLRLSVDLISDAIACEYSRGSGGMRPFLLNK